MDIHERIQEAERLRIEDHEAAEAKYNKAVSTAWADWRKEDGKDAQLEKDNGMEA